jgi:hypothetical protein
MTELGKDPSVPGTREEQAYHEAGHAVALVLAGIPFFEVDMISGPRPKVIMREIDGIQGTLYPPTVEQLQGEAFELESSVEAIWREDVVVRFAGPASHRRYLGHMGRPDLGELQRFAGGEDIDFAKRMALAIAFARSSHIDRMRAFREIREAGLTKAYDVVNTNWAAITDVAVMLMVEDHLGEEVVKDIVSAHIGTS